jgi:hypothetical protein
MTNTAADDLNDPKVWRRRAKEARFQADRINDPESKRAMLSVAQTYDRLAKRAEMRPTEEPSALP